MKTNEAGIKVSELPSISIVIPTYNSERTLAQCLESITKQDYPREKIEVIVADGGSKDRTIEIARKYGVGKILHNPLRTGEAGKAIGVYEAKNELIALIDSDNVLTENDWFKKMVKPFKDQSIIGAEPLYYTYRRRDPLIVRYCALLGMNDPLCLYMENYDRYSHVTGKWTGLTIKTARRADYLVVKIDESNIPTIGANGFLVRAEILKKLSYKSYLFDVDVIYQLVKIGQNQFAKVKIGIVHLFADNIKIFFRKTYRRIRDYLYYERYGMRKYPWLRAGRLKLQKFIFYTLIILPITRDLIKGYHKVPDRAWLFHPLACQLTLLTYAITFMFHPRR